MGHGGTLDPMATGVLIIGIGRGTKSLQNFLGCTKTYETVVLFGKSTDTYDVAGKVVSTKSTGHITKDLVEEKLAAFRGDIKQIPPIYSALKIQGMKAYEYARTGKELPKELAAREMKVDECTLVEWLESGQHDLRWPATEVDGEEPSAVASVAPSTGAELTERSEASQQVLAAGATNAVSPGSQSKSASPSRPASVIETAKQHTHVVEGLSATPADAPAARIRLTVSSGFYVRSFCHDLGIACDSYGTMAELARTRQGEYTIADAAQSELTPALAYDDLQQGEEIWGPKIQAVLSKWLEKNPAPIQHHVAGEHFRRNDGRRDRGGRGSQYGGKRKHGQYYRIGDRNSSSPERET